MGAALGEAIAILDPELVLLGGGILQKLGDSFVETLVLEIPKSAMPTKPLPPVKSSSFGADAGVIGAATLVLHDAYAPSLRTRYCLEVVAGSPCSRQPARVSIRVFYWVVM